MSSPPTSSSSHRRDADIRTTLLRHQHDGANDSPTTSTRPQSPDLPGGFRSYGAIQYPADDTASEASFPAPRHTLSDSIETSSITQRRKKATQIARESGVKHPRLMVASYYIPSLAWVANYKSEYLLGDLVAGITMSSIYIPLALSLASNLAHVPPVQGLYAFAINPFIYAVLGSTTQMVVGPEAAGSMLVGEAVRLSINKGTTHEDDAHKNALLAGIVSSLAGLIIFFAGMIRVGFLEGVLSRALLRGFLSAIGFVIFIDQLIPELGLDKRAKEAGVKHSAPIYKVVFLLKNLTHMHVMTAAVALISFSIIMVSRSLKIRFQKRHHWIIYIPDRFLVVVTSTILAGTLNWSRLGLEILGPVSSDKFTFQFPYTQENLPKIREVMGTSFLIAILGFFESVVASKSLGTSDNNHSPNRELVALGVANMFGGLGCALPAFGGYGRSKLNASTGGRTPMSSIFLSLITVCSTIWLLPFFQYIPKCVLSAMLTAVAFSMLEEAPADIRFFSRIRSYPDLLTMSLVFFLTIFYSLELGIAAGVGLSIVTILRHSTRSRIQILGLVPPESSSDSNLKFKSAEDFPEEVVHVDGCLIVKIPEPLTFANASDLKTRLHRLDIYGSLNAHPSLPRLRDQGSHQNVIFDVHGLTGMDGSATQTLKEIVAGYIDKGVTVYFTRGPRAGGEVWSLMERGGIVDMVGGSRRFLNSIQDALREAEVVDGSVRSV